MKLDDLPETLFLLRRLPSPNSSGGDSTQSLSLVFAETERGELVLFLWSSLAAVISWQLETGLNAQVIETQRDELLRMIRIKIPGCFLFYNAKPGETTFNLFSDRMIQLPID